MSNLDLVRRVVARLGVLQSRVVLVGGALAELLITDTGAGEVRPTEDVDFVVDGLSSYADYMGTFRDQLVGLGFVECSEEGAPLCRWVVDGVRVDLMPTDPAALGFANAWYVPATARAQPYHLDGGLTVRGATAPYFLATKISAFEGRGQEDYLGSHDLEDIVAIVDGRAELADEMRAAPADVRAFVQDFFVRLLGTPAFRDALPGYLLPDAASQTRLPLLEQRLQALAAPM